MQNDNDSCTECTQESVSLVLTECKSVGRSSLFSMIAEPRVSQQIRVCNRSDVSLTGSQFVSLCSTGGKQRLPSKQFAPRTSRTATDLAS